MLVATRCEDGGVPWPAGTPIGQRHAAVGAALDALPPGQLAPFTVDTLRESGIADLCNAWPESPIPQPRPPLPDVPALILSGDVDLRTPRSYAIALAARLPRAQLLTVPQTGHSVLGSDISDCASSAVTDFFAGNAVRACGRARLPGLLRPLDPPARRLSRLRPHRGLSPHVGRTVTAVRQTIDMMGRTVVLELLSQLLRSDRHTRALRFGGLRGGSLAISRRGMVLRRYTVVPGVTLSAVADDDDAPVLVHVGGRAASHGALRVGDRWIAGTLGGHRVRVRIDDDSGGAVISRTARVTPGGVPVDRVLRELPPALRTLLGRR